MRGCGGARHPDPALRPARPRSKDIIENKTELEKKIDEAIYAKHGTATTILREIASATQHQ